MERGDKGYSEWKARVNVRDNFTCQDCGKKEVNETHHIKSWKDCPDLRYDLNNGKTLCLDCHKKYKSVGRPKLKKGKRVNFYISLHIIEQIENLSWKNKMSMSSFIEFLIDKYSKEGI